MILFPNAKINLGLRILRKRHDGYHDIKSVLYPVGWCDILEIVPAPDGCSRLMVYGGSDAVRNCPPEKNLVMKAYRAVEKLNLPGFGPAHIFLRKNIPDGAGLGGGSADAAFTVMGLNNLFSLGLSVREMAGIAAGIGADCPFFIHNRPMLASGTGTELKSIDVNLKGVGCILIAKPVSESVSTKEAYSGVKPKELSADENLEETLSLAPEHWHVVKNDFEDPIFLLRPEIKALKRKFENHGAIYTAMSGSGASVFGLFRDCDVAEDLKRLLSENEMETYLERLSHN